MVRNATVKPNEFNDTSNPGQNPAIERHVIRFGPDWADIIVIEGEAVDEDVTKDWKDKHGVQSSDVFNAWARQDQ
jgi:hypothetical protein